MKQKLLTIKSLLVAALLGVGVNGAWAADEVYNFRNFISGLNNNATLVKGSSVTVGENTMYLVADFTKANYSILRDGHEGKAFNTNGRFAVGSETWQLRRRTDAGYMIRPSSAAGTFSILNLNEGDKIVFDITTSDGSDTNDNDSQITFASTNAKVQGGATNVSAGDNIVDGTTYVMTADGHLDIALAQWVGFRSITITPNPDVETVTAPSITAIAANGEERTVEISGGSTSKDGASIASYRYTTDGSTEPSASVGTVYDSGAKIVINATTTIKAVAISTTGKASAVITKEIEAGTSIQLVTPSVVMHGMNKVGSAVYPIYKFTSDNSTKIGSPSATLKYSFTPTVGDKTNGTLTDGVFTFPSTGTVTVTAEADGYTTSAGKDQEGELYYEVSFYNFKSLTQDILTDGEKADVDDSSIGGATGTKGFVFEIPRTLDRFTFNTDGSNGGKGWQLTWAITADKAFGVGIHGSSRYYVSTTLEEGEIGMFSTKNSGNVFYTTSGDNLRFYNQEVLYNFGVYAKAPATTSVEVSAAGMATYVNNYYALDFTSVTENLKAYKVKVNDKAVATLTQVNQVPAGTPVLLIGETQSVPVIASAAAVSDNDLVAGTGAAVATTDGGYTNMVLAKKDEKVGFFFASGKTVAANRAYLHIATTLAPANNAPMMLVFDGETTGVNEVRSKMADVRGEFYNLAGQRVAQPTKGLYIVNGKKVVIK